MKQSSDKANPRPQQLEQSEVTTDKKNPGTRKPQQQNEGPATQWPGPLDRQLSFSER